MQEGLILYEAAFVYQDVLIRDDILKQNEDGSWDLLEVKSSTNRAKPKKEYILDLADQKYVLLAC